MKKVIEEWIEEKGSELWDWFEDSLDGSYTITPHKCKAFIRSLIKEIAGVEETASNARDAYGGYREDE